MAQEIDLQIRFEAEDLYVEARKTYEQVSEATGVSVTQLKRWSKESNWRQKRVEHLKNKRTLKEQLVKLRDAMLKKAVDSKDPQKAYAALKVVKLQMDSEKKDAVEIVEVDRPKIFLEDMEFIAETLKDVDPQGLKVFSRNFDVIVNRFKEQHAQAS
ncbi:hypothetical protein DSCW_18290 [Desulfosarcina widdelii]|uniref:Uncharacterized protein n=1 Tax=Desulfosarcina widdelii TaxID=947919 RepID=A0A5K7YXB0_9BACT|nr:hypothetical protein [Desulfosarcina widdelii]BBO74412.1 hypothetical protein DSCW_18290 [Desulfosarcina widdelii]